MTEIVECSEEQAKDLVEAGGRILEHRSVWGDPNLRCLVQKGAAKQAEEPKPKKAPPKPAEPEGEE